MKKRFLEDFVTILTKQIEETRKPCTLEIVLDPSELDSMETRTFYLA